MWNEPTYPTSIKVGDIIKVDKFCFTNTAGGTGLSDSDWNEKFPGIAEIKVTKIWWDYETGWKGWAEPVSSGLKEYLKKNANQETKVLDFGEKIEIPANTVFWSEFDVLK